MRNRNQRQAQPIRRDRSTESGGFERGERFEGQGRGDQREAPTYWRGGRRHVSGYAGNEDARGTYEQGYRAVPIDEGEDYVHDEHNPALRDDEDEIDFDERSWSAYSSGQARARRDGYGGEEPQPQVRASYGGSVRGGRGMGYGSGFGGGGAYGGAPGGGGEFRGGATYGAGIGGGGLRSERGYGGQMRGRGREGETAMMPGSWRSRGWGGEEYQGGVGGPNYESPYARGRFGGGSEQYQDRGERSLGYGGQPATHVGKGPRGYKRSDERIREDVCERLTEHHEVDASDVEVEVRGGEVTLTGAVSHRSQKIIAEQIAESVGGVVDIHNQIRVRREPSVAASPSTSTSSTSTSSANGSSSGSTASGGNDERRNGSGHRPSR